MHGVGEAEIEHAQSAADEDDGKVLYLGPDRAGGSSEIMAVFRDDGTEVVIHAMRMRRIYESLLREPGDADARQEVLRRSKAGVELTAGLLEQMVERAEAGLDVTKLCRRPGRPAMGSGPADTFPVRLDPELRKAVDDRAAAEHDCVRRRPRSSPPLP
jgi:hypothetical protein